MTQESNGYLELADGKLYYEQAGEGQPLVLVHAGFVDSRMWDEQWAAFARHYRVIRFDMRGYGQSDPAGAPLNRRAELYTLLHHLGVERAALVGCSLGGTTILDFALEHPQMVSALVAVSATPGGFEMQGEPPRYLFEMLAAAEQGDLALASELQNRIWIDGPFREPQQVAPQVRQRAAAMNQIALAHGTMFLDMAPDPAPLAPPAAQRLGELSMPTLLMAGELDHPEILRATEEMGRAISRAQTVLLPGAAHLPNMEQPEAFNRQLLAFLQATISPRPASSQ